MKGRNAIGTMPLSSSCDAVLDRHDALLPKTSLAPPTGDRNEAFIPFDLHDLLNHPVRPCRKRHRRFVDPVSQGNIS